MKKTVLILALCLSACATSKPLQLGSLRIGMTKLQVISVLNRRPDNTIGARSTAAGTVEVVQYTRHPLGAPEERYWLYFYNDALQQWGRPGDWEREADRIIEYRIK